MATIYAFSDSDSEFNESDAGVGSIDDDDYSENNTPFRQSVAPISMSLVTRIQKLYYLVQIACYYDDLYKLLLGAVPERANFVMQLSYHRSFWSGTPYEYEQGVTLSRHILRTIIINKLHRGCPNLLMITGTIPVEYYAEPIKYVSIHIMIDASVKNIYTIYANDGSHYKTIDGRGRCRRHIIETVALFAGNAYCAVSADI